MNITYILPVSWGGILHYTVELANNVSKYENVTVLKPKDSNDKLFSDDVILKNSFQPLQYFKGNERKLLSINNLRNLFSYRNIREIDGDKSDIIHVTNVYPHTSFFMYLYKTNRSHNLFYTIHSTSASYLYSPSKRGLIPALLGGITDITKMMVKPNKIIVHSDENKKMLIGENINPDDIYVIPHGAFSLFEKYSNNSKSRDDNTILFFGYIVQTKGLEYLIKSIPYVIEKIPDVNVIIAGEGNIERYSKYIKNKSNFEIYNNYIPDEKVHELFKRAKILILPYTNHQGHSGVMSLAYTFKKSTIVTNVGDLPNLVDNGKNGLIVPPKDEKALAKAIIKLLKNDQLREEMEKNAYKKSKMMSWDNIAKKHIELYQKSVYK